MRRIISMLLENEPGALARVAGLFSARGYNIESLTVAPTEDDSMSRLTLVTSGDQNVIEQITKQLNKLVEIIKLVDLTEGAHVERELLLLKVRASGAQRADVLQLVEIFRGRVLDVTATTLIVEVTGTGEKLDAFVHAIDEKTIQELARSGAMGMGRGEKSLRV
jgi:acetolactate synthase I/III small subunit